MPPDDGFTGKTVVISGAAGGIGRALCLRFGREGARIAALDLDREGLDALAGELRDAGIDALIERCDVTDPDQCALAMKSVEQRFGGVDVLINNAGISHRSPAVETELPVYRRVMDVNFFGAVHCTKPALPSLLERRGLIIVISSIAGRGPLPGRTGYSASKHALHGFFETLRCELASRGVRVMMVCPSFTATKIERSALDGKGNPTSRAWDTVGKIATPESVAEAVYRGARSGRRMIVLSPTGRAAELISRLWPALYERIVSRKFPVDAKH